MSESSGYSTFSNSSSQQSNNGPQSSSNTQEMNFTTLQAGFVGAVRETETIEDDSGEEVGVLSIEREVDKIIKIQDLNAKPKSSEVSVRSFNNILNFAVDTGSAASFINKATCEALIRDKESNAMFKNMKDVNLGLRFIDYNHQNIELLGALYVNITSARYKVQRARFLVVDKKRCLIGLDLQVSIGIVTKQISYHQRYPKEFSSVEDKSKVEKLFRR